MRIELPWGPGALHLETPDTWTVHFPRLTQSPTAPPRDELKPVRDALRRPVGARALSALTLKNKNILIVVDDNTRPTPTHKFFHLVIDELKKAGAEEKRMTILTALGIHTPMTEAEMREKVGASNLAKIEWENHDAFNLERLHRFGYTSLGTPVILNQRILYSDIIVSVGMIEPHLWAGFGGGLKNILPGIAAADCIAIHHGVIAEPPYRYNSVGMLPEENPFRTDLEEIVRHISIPIFCLNVLIDHQRRIVDAVAGDPIASHRAGVEKCIARSGLAIERQVDGIIVCSNPMDINFKQSMKGVGNSLPALRPGGVVMGFLRAERGMDDITLPDKSKPLWLVKRLMRALGPARVMWLLDKVKTGLTVEERFLTYYSMQLMREHDLFFHVPTVSDDEVRRMAFFENFPEAQAVIDRGARALGPDAHVAVFPEAGATFPIVGQRSPAERL